MGLPSGSVARFVLGGPISPQDIWSISIWATPASIPATQAIFDDTTAGVLNSFKTLFWAASTSPWNTIAGAQAKLATCRGYLYTGGLLSRQSAASITPNAGASTSVCPATTASVFTLLTAGTGRSYRGRVYLPATGSMSATEQINNLQVHVDHFKDFLNAGPLGGWGSGSPSPVYNPVVVSQKLGASSVITGVRNDSLPDTQRGRQNKATAERTFSAAF